jgi:ribosomal-protein-alanine N-acetyltransferase
VSATGQRREQEDAAPAAPFALRGPSLTIRYATAADAPRLFELARDPAVTRFFSWGPYERVVEAEAYIAGLPAKREAGVLLDFVMEHADDGVIGVTGLSELSVRDRRAVIGSWFGHRWWGSGLNRESKAMMTALAFGRLGLERVTAWANTANGRSQAALERLGWSREGVLANYHRHGDQMHDLVIYGLLREAWERSELAQVPVEIEGEAPANWVVASGRTHGLT